MTYGSLFSGIGGIDLGLDRAGFQCRWQVEIDPYALRVLEKHWPNVARYGDITKLDGTELEPVDLMAGGFPCQDLSQAGKQAGIEGTRSGLWFEYARIIRELRPRYVLIENVPGLLIHDAMRRVIGELDRLGYVGIWRSLRASEFGASHLRKRVFIVAYRSRNGRREGRPESGWIEGRPDAYERGSAMEHALRTGLEVGDGQRELQFHRDSTALAPGLPAFAPGPSDPRWPAILAARPDLAPALANTERHRVRRESAEGRGSQRRTASDGTSGGICAGPEETPQSPICGMADGLSDLMDRAMKDRTKRLGRLGNAVVPEVAEWIGRRIMEFEEVYA